MTPRPTPLALLAATACLLATASAHAGHSPLDGSLHVLNDRAMPLRVTIDGDPAGEVPARGARVFPAVANGLRLVVLAGPHGHEVVERVAVPVQGRATLRVAPVLGSAVLRNDSGLPMRVTVDDRPAGVVPRGGTLELPALPAGPHRLAARPAGHAGPPVEQRFHVRAGERTALRLGDYLGSLAVTNPLPRRAALFVDGARVARLSPGQSVVLGGQAPGEHRLSLRAGGRVLAEATVSVGPGERVDWRPAPAWHGSLQVTNALPAPVKVLLDGRKVATLKPGRTQMLEGLAPGPHTLVTQVKGRAPLAREVVVQADRVAIVTVGGATPVQTAWTPQPPPAY